MYVNILEVSSAFFPYYYFILFPDLALCNLRFVHIYFI